MGEHDADKKPAILAEPDERSRIAIDQDEQKSLDKHVSVEKQAPVDEEAGRVFKIRSLTFTGKQALGGLCYLAAYGFFLTLALRNTDNTRLALAWLIAATVTSQVFIDISKFSSAESKGRFTAVFRIISAVIALVVVLTV